MATDNYFLIKLVHVFVIVFCVCYTPTCRVVGIPMDTTNSYHFWTRVKLALVSHVVSQFQDGNLTTNANREGLSGTSFSITINYIILIYLQ
jgi:hypothetical protein